MEQMCANTPYAEEIGIPQMKELVSLYDLDGFFIDIFWHAGSLALRR
jgi:hypothetical protein